MTLYEKTQNTLKRINYLTHYKNEMIMTTSTMYRPLPNCINFLIDKTQLPKFSQLVLLFALLGFSLVGFGQDEILLYGNDFETYNIEPSKNGCYLDNDNTFVNVLWGGTSIGIGGNVLFAQTFTVETMLINGEDNRYVDTKGNGGNYCIGMLSTAQDDMLSLTLDSKGLTFLNISFSLSAIDLDGCGSAGVSTPIMKIIIYDSPEGVFNFSNPGNSIGETTLTGIEPNTDKYIFNWTEVNSNVNIEESTNGNISIVFDLKQSGYAAFDNLRITATETCNTTEINLENGIVAHYPFQGNATDVSSNKNNGELFGASLTTDRFGNEGDAFHFDGNSYISIADDPTLRPQNFTISLWCRFDDLSDSTKVLIDKHLIDGNDTDSYELWFSDSQINGCLSDEDGVSEYIRADLQPNTTDWYHIVYSFSDENNIKSLYINNTLANSLEESKTIDYTNTPINIGASYLSETELQYFFKGDIDDVRIYDRVLSSCEIEALFELPYVSYIEDCADGIDNDNDGYVDCEDLDCQNNLLYSNNFENEIGNEWSLIKTETINNSTVLGVFNRSDVHTLSLSNLPLGDSITICFDLWILGTWDGSDDNFKDVITVSTSDNQTLLDATFANADKSQTFPNNIGGASNPSGTGAVLSGNYYGTDTVYPDRKYEICKSFLATSIILELNFSSSTSEANTEVYAIDNILITKQRNENCIEGCLDQVACNFNPAANIDDGSCDFGAINCLSPCEDILGCINPDAENYNIDATCDDGSCIIINPCEETETINLNQNLIAYYPFSGNANDESENNNNGEVFGAELTTDSFGNESSAYQFGGDDYISIPNSPELENLSEEFTISIRFQTQSYFNSDVQWAVSFDKKRQLAFYYTDQGAIYFNDDIITTKTLDLNVWYNATFTLKNSTLSFYLNNQLNVETAISPIIPNSENLNIGRDNPGEIEYFKGKIDDILIYNRALNQCEIEAIYKGKKPTSFISEENTASTCSDGIDNDGDGLVDCEEPECDNIIPAYNDNSCVPCMLNPTSFADSISVFETECSFYQNLNEILGPPDAGSGNVSRMLSLGPEGRAVIHFTDNLLVNSGNSAPDIYVFESGSAPEIYKVALKPFDQQTLTNIESRGFLPNENGFYLLGEVRGQPSSIDIDSLFLGFSYNQIKFDAVEIVGVLSTENTSWDSCSNNYAGSDIDAVCALTSIIPIEGCTNQTACNYNPNANIDNNSCIFETSCNSDCLLGDIEIWNNEICQCEVEQTTVLGCTDINAENYNSSANCDDYSCEFEEIIQGCTDETACNYNPEATVDDGSCNQPNFCFLNCDNQLIPNKLPGSLCQGDPNAGLSYIDQNCECFDLFFDVGLNCILEPAGGQVIGDEYCFQITVVDTLNNNMPIPNTPVNFAVDGANEGLYDFGFSDENGIVKLCYTPTNPGQDFITITSGNFTFTFVNIIWDFSGGIGTYLNFNYDLNFNHIYNGMSSPQPPESLIVNDSLCTTITILDEDSITVLAGVDVTIISTIDGVEQVLVDTVFTTNLYGQIEFCPSSLYVGIEECILTTPFTSDTLQYVWQPIEVPCQNQPGQMQTANSFVCDGAVVYVREAFSTIDENSVRMYVMHEEEIFDGINYIAMSESGRFTSPSTAYTNRPLYISAVVGPPDENGLPKLNDECTEWTPYGAEYTFFDPINITIIEERCEGGLYFIDVSLTGGVGGISNNFAYRSIFDGITLYQNVAKNEVVTFGPYQGTGNYNIFAIGGKGCPGEVSGSFNCGEQYRSAAITQSGLETYNIAYPNADLRIEAAQVFNTNGQCMPSNIKIDDNSCEVELANMPHDIYFVQLLISNKVTGKTYFTSEKIFKN